MTFLRVDAALVRVVDGRVRVGTMNADDKLPAMETMPRTTSVAREPA
jgi:hypothetical protein